MNGSNGEFRFDLQERTDRYGQKYLFAGIKMLGIVLFVRPDDAPSADGRKRWRAVAKKYNKKEENREFDWPEE